MSDEKETKNVLREAEMLESYKSERRRDLQLLLIYYAELFLIYADDFGD